MMDYKVENNGVEFEIEAKKISDNIVDRLVQYRKELKMTQQDIADATGIKRANIARIESKKHAITLECLVKYAGSMNLELHMEIRPKKRLHLHKVSLQSKHVNKN